jgi:hypothetical protein
MKTRLIELVARLLAELINATLRALHAIQTPLTLQEMAAPLRWIPLAKAEEDRRPAIIPNFLDSKAEVKPEHAAFDDMFYAARTAVVRDSRLEEDFRNLGAFVVAALRARMSESEICRLPFRGAMVSPSFVAEVRERGLEKTHAS